MRQALNKLKIGLQANGNNELQNFISTFTIVVHVHVDRECAI